MSATVKLTVVRGGLKGKKFIFDHPIVCTLGRDPRCLLQLPDNSEFCEISRRHCAFAIDPPQMSVRDLGSRNGTFINGQNIGQRLIEGEAPDERNTSLEYTVDDGDQIRVGNLVFQVGITETCSDDADPVLYEPDEDNLIAQREWCDVCPCV